MTDRAERRRSYCPADQTLAAKRGVQAGDRRRGLDTRVGKPERPNKKSADSRQQTNEK